MSIRLDTITALDRQTDHTDWLEPYHCMLTLDDINSRSAQLHDSI